MASESQLGHTFCICSKASCHQLVTKIILVELHMTAGGYQHAIADLSHALVNTLPEQKVVDLE